MIEIIRNKKVKEKWKIFVLLVFLKLIILVNYVYFLYILNRIRWNVYDFIKYVYNSLFSGFVELKF